MANPFDKFKDVDIDALRNLKQAKDAYGVATTDQQRQEASALGDSIRSKAGIQADSAGLLNAQQLDELIKQREAIPTVNSTPENPMMDAQALANKIAETKKAQALAKFNQQFAQTQGRLEQEKSQIDPRFLDATGRTQTQGAMNQRAMENAMAQGGLATSGARFQSELGLRGQQLAQQGMNERDRLGQIADVERRTTEAQQIRDLGIGGIEAEADIANLQSQLTQLEQQQVADLKAAEIADERSFEIYKMELDKITDNEKIILENELTRDNKALDFEIDQLLNNQKFEQAQQLEAIKTQNSAKLEAIKQSGRMAELGAKQAFDREMSTSGSGLSGDGFGGYSTASMEKGINNFLNRTKDDREMEINNKLTEINKEIQAISDKQNISNQVLTNEDYNKIISLESQSNALKNQSADLSGKLQTDYALEWIYRNSDKFKDDNQLMEVAKNYGIENPQQLLDYKAKREAALNDRPFE